MKKSGAGGALGAGIFLMSLAGLAWACTAQSYIVPVVPRVAPGSELALTGQVHATGQVQVHWNSEGGPMLGSADATIGQVFAVSVNVPDAHPGVHYIVLTYDGAGIARTPIELTGGTAESQAAPGIRTVSSDTWSGFAASPGSSPGQGQSSISQPQRDAGTVAGIALLSVGLLGLLGGAAAAGTRRRRTADGR